LVLSIYFNKKLEKIDLILQDSCDTLYKSTRKLVFEIEENRCAVTGAAVLGGKIKIPTAQMRNRYF